jgi:hypothetical protein
MSDTTPTSPDAPRGQHDRPPTWQPPKTPPLGAPAGTGQQMSLQAERNWAMAAHLSSFAAAYVALGFLGPLVVLLAVGNRSPFVRRHAVEALNFNLTWLLYIAVAAVLAWLLVGIPLLILLGLGYLVLVVLAAIEASNGREYRYPLTIRLVR